MSKLLNAALVGALALAPIATVANAQSGYDTGAGKSGETTTNSGQARPDSTKNGAAAPEAGQTSRAKPTQGADGSGSGTARPDADTKSNATGGVTQPTPTKAAPTDTKN